MDTCMSEWDPELQVDIPVWKSSPLKVWVNIQVIDIWNSTRAEWLDQLQDARQGQWKRNGITSQNSGSKVGKEDSIDHGENLVLMAQCLHLPPVPLGQAHPWTSENYLHLENWDSPTSRHQMVVKTS